MTRGILPALTLFFLLFALDASSRGLDFGDVRVSVDYDDAYTYRLEKKDRLSSESNLLNNSVIRAEVYPGANVTFTYWVKNTFQSSNGTEIRGITSKTTIGDLDDGADVEYDSDEFDLDPGNDYRVDVKFLIPIYAEMGMYDVMIEAEGDDKDDNVYRSAYNLKLEVKKQSHDIRIYKVLLSPSVLYCDKKAKLTAEIVNAGRSDESNVGLEFRSASIGINSYDLNIPLESSEEDTSLEDKVYSKTIDLTLPSFMSTGKYIILINLYWKNYILFDQEKVELEIRDCDRSIVKNETKQPEVVVVKNDTQPKPIVESEAKTGPPSSINNTTLYAIIFGGMLIITIFSMIAFWYMK